MDSNVILTGISVLNLLLLSVIVSLILKAINIIDRTDQSKSETNPEHIKISYSLFVTFLQEYDSYFTVFELGKFTNIKDNELTESEYKILSKRYVEGFIEQHRANSDMINNLLVEIFGDYESFVMYMLRRFDMILYKNYPALGFNQSKVDKGFIKK